MIKPIDASDAGHFYEVALRQVSQFELQMDMQLTRNERMYLATLIVDAMIEALRHMLNALKGVDPESTEGMGDETQE